MIFIYLLYQDNLSNLRIEFRGKERKEQEERKEQDNDNRLWNILLSLPCYNKEKVISFLGLENQSQNLSSSFTWKEWIQKIIDVVDIEVVDIEPKEQKEKEKAPTEGKEQNSEQQEDPEQEKRIENENQIKEVVQDTPPISKSQSDETLSNSLENIKFTIAEENTKLTSLLHKISMFKTNVSKIQNNLQSIKKYKLPTNANHPPPVFVSERPSKSTTEVITFDECKQWLKNKSINPKTNRKIETDGPTYKKFLLMSQMYGLLKN